MIQLLTDLSPKISRPRRALIGILLGINLIALTFSVERNIDSPQSYRPKYQTIAHRFLALESRYDPSVGDDELRMLDEIIDDVKSKVRYDSSITDKEKKRSHLLTIFQAIDSTLLDRNFIFPPGEWTATLGEAFDAQRLSSSDFDLALKHPLNERRIAHMRAHADEPFHLIACGPNAFLYLGVCQAIGIPLKAVLVPQHIYVRADLDATDHVNWDANRGISIPDEEYIMGWHVTDAQVRQQVYMKPLTPDDLEGEMYCSVGVHLVNHMLGMNNGEIECYRKALALEPTNLYASNNLAICLLFCADPGSEARQEALDLARRTVGFQPNMPQFLSTLAYAWAANNRINDAVATMNQAVALDPTNEDLRQSIPLLKHGYNVYTIFKSRHPISCWIRYEHGWIVVSLAPVGALALVVLRRILRRRLAAQSQPLPVAPVISV